jgi:hypothetical protein
MLRRSDPWANGLNSEATFSLVRWQANKLETRRGDPPEIPKELRSADFEPSTRRGRVPGNPIARSALQKGQMCSPSLPMYEHDGHDFNMDTNIKLEVARGVASNLRSCHTAHSSVKILNPARFRRKFFYDFLSVLLPA